jgi:hypothetical protein
MGKRLAKALIASQLIYTIIIGIFFIAVCFYIADGISHLTSGLVGGRCNDLYYPIEIAGIVTQDGRPFEGVQVHITNTPSLCPQASGIDMLLTSDNKGRFGSQNLHVHKSNTSVEITISADGYESCVMPASAGQEIELEIILTSGMEVVARRITSSVLNVQQTPMTSESIRDEILCSSA